MDPGDLERLRVVPASPRSPARLRTGRADALATRMAAGDDAGSWAIVEAALVAGLAPAEVYLALLAPALRTVGDRWEAGTFSVADEHRATVVAHRLLGRLGPRFARRGRKRGAVVVGAPAGELHGLPCALVADLLRGPASRCTTWVWMHRRSPSSTPPGRPRASWTC